MTATLTVPRSSSHWARIINASHPLQIFATIHDHNWVVAQYQGTSITLDDLNWERLSDFFNNPALKPVHVHFPRTPHPDFILYVHETCYIPAFVKPISYPMLDVHEGSSQLVFFCNSNFNALPSLKINVEIPPPFRHVKTPILFDRQHNSVYAYRAAQAKLQSLFNTSTIQTDEEASE